MEEKLTVDFVWNNITPDLRDEVVQFWISNGAIVEKEQAEKRADELVGICRNEKKEIIGVSTHMKQFFAPLQNHFHYSRIYVMESYRHQGVMKKIFLSVWGNFNEKKRFEKEGIVGVLAVMENEHLNSRTQAVWPDFANMVCVGFDRRGFQIRVGYFPEANILLPQKNQ